MNHISLPFYSFNSVTPFFSLSLAMMNKWCVQVKQEDVELQVNERKKESYQKVMRNKRVMKTKEVRIRR